MDIYCSDLPPPIRQTYLSILSEYSDILFQEIEKLTTHHFIAKNQSNYLKNLKETLKPKEAIIILDFTENSFVLQDAVQRYRWNNSHATLHPFADYYRGDEGQLCNTNICVISGCHKHDVVAVHSYLKVVLKKFTSDTSHRTSKIYYFTDGAASQYKNTKISVILCIIVMISD